MSTEKLAKKVHKALTAYLDYDQSQDPHIKGKEKLLLLLPEFYRCLYSSVLAQPDSIQSSSEKEAGSFKAPRSVSFLDDKVKKKKTILI